MTTLGVIGLGRIGAFHVDTLSGLAGVDRLVVADERPDVVAAVAAIVATTRRAEIRPWSTP